MKKIVFASSNKHKIEEVKEILQNFEILSLKDINFFDEIVEDGNTFKENSIIKARAISTFLQENNLTYPVLADDSGLCVEALNGAPGVYSARFTPEETSETNRIKLLSLLENENNRNAYFECNMTLILPNKLEYYGIGKTFGTITTKYYGKTDFGYDCIFKSLDLNKTFGEANDEEKNSVSHRKRAIENLLENLRKENIKI